MSLNLDIHGTNIFLHDQCLIHLGCPFDVYMLIDTYLFKLFDRSADQKISLLNKTKQPTRQGLKCSAWERQFCLVILHTKWWWWWWVVAVGGVESMFSVQPGHKLRKTKLFSSLIFSLLLTVKHNPANESVLIIQLSSNISINTTQCKPSNKTGILLVKICYLNIGEYCPILQLKAQQRL